MKGIARTNKGRQHVEMGRTVIDRFEVKEDEKALEVGSGRVSAVYVSYLNEPFRRESAIRMRYERNSPHVLQKISK